MATRTRAKDARTPALAQGRVWKGNPALIPFLVPVGSLHEDPANARTHEDRSIASIAASYQRFGQQKPVVCGQDMVVRDGNGQFRAAAERLGWTHVAALPSDLGGVELSAYALAVNRTAELAEWDFESLAGQLRAIQDSGASVGDLGWDDAEVESLLSAELIPAGGAAPGSDTGAGAAAPPAEADIRVIQLFLTSASHAEFTGMVDDLGVVYGTTNMTDTVVRSVRDAHAAGRRTAAG